MGQPDIASQMLECGSVDLAKALIREGDIGIGRSQTVSIGQRWYDSMQP